MPAPNGDVTWIEFSGLPLATAAYRVRNPLLVIGGPGQAGSMRRLTRGRRRRYPRYPTSTTVTLELVIFGQFNRLGTPYSDTAEGLALNANYLATNICAPVETGDGTRPGILHTATETFSGVAYVGPLQLGDPNGGFTMPATIDVEIPPPGRFTLDP